jgi:hypothetical protein
MTLQHYIGGLEGLGPVEFDKRVFADEWEKRIFGIHVTVRGLSTSNRRPARFRRLFDHSNSVSTFLLFAVRYMIQPLVFPGQ